MVSPEMNAIENGANSTLRWVRGFSAIELMVVVSIAAIMITLAIPSFERTRRNAVLATAANDLSASLNYARAHAVKARRMVRVCPSTDGTNCSNGAWGSGWLMFVDDDANGLPANTEVLRLGEPPDSRVALTVPANFTNWIQFHPTGAITGSGGNSGTFTLCSGDYHEYSRLVAISATGRVTTKKQPDLCSP
jgi:prepilin-type N-terminal cleavage/methylation domain-containing protein